MNPRVLKARAYVRPAFRQNPWPAVVRADGADYVLKPRLLDNIPSQFFAVNELVASQLTRLFDVPVPETVLIDVEADFSDAISVLPPQLTRRVTRPLPAPELLPGLHFGSKFIQDCLEAPESLVSQVGNAQQLVNLLVADCATNNCDRYCNVLVRQSREGLEFVGAIDFAQCFGGGGMWNEDSLKPQIRVTWNGLDFGPLHRARGWRPSLPFMGSIRGHVNPGSLGEAVNRCRAIRREQVNAIVDAVPPSWSLSPSKATALKEYLWDRLQTIESLLESRRELFPNWTRAECVSAL